MVRSKIHSKRLKVSLRRKQEPGTFLAPVIISLFAICYLRLGALERFLTLIE